MAPSSSNSRRMKTRSRGPVASPVAKKAKDGNKGKKRRQTKKEFVYEAHLTLIGTDGWNDWVESEPDWATLFPVNSRENSSISPRMAALLFNEGVIIVDEFNLDPEYIMDDLPSIARSCICKSKSFRESFLACFERVLLRLCKGIVPYPNCLGEMLALKFMISGAEEHGCILNDWDWTSETFPVTPFDENFHRVRKGFFSSKKDLLALKLCCETDYDSDDDSDSDEESSCYLDDEGKWRFDFSDNDPSPLDDSPRDMKSYARNKVRLFPESPASGKPLDNLHPGRRFVAFSTKNVTNHL